MARTRLDLLIAELQKARKRHRLSQDNLAIALGTSALAVGSWESGKDNPTTANFLRWAESLGYVAVIGDASQGYLACTTPLKGEPLEAYRTRCLVAVLRDAREKANWSQEMVGDALGVSSWSVHMWRPITAFLAWSGSLSGPPSSAAG